MANFPDLFNAQRGQFFNGSFRSDLAEVFFGDLNFVGLLAQNIQFTYSQQITRLYEVGSAAIYYVAGRAQGQLGMANVAGPQQLNVGWIKKYADVCQAAENDLTFRAQSSCNTAFGQTSNYLINGCVLTTLGIAIAAPDMVINQNAQMTFAAMDLA